MSNSMLLMLPNYVNIDTLLTFAMLRGFSVSVILQNIELLVSIPFLFVGYTEEQKITLWQNLVNQ